jgi:hypothetical protein
MGSLLGYGTLDAVRHGNDSRGGDCRFAPGAIDQNDIGFWRPFFGREATRGPGFIILSPRSKPSDMRARAESAESNEGQGFTLARVGWFPYNPVDFSLLRGGTAEIAVASLNGQPKKR